MSAFNLALVTLISLGSICANPADKAVEKNKYDCLYRKDYNFVITNAINGNECFKPNAKCDSRFEVYLAEQGNTQLKKIACAKPCQSVPFSLPAKFVDEKLAALLFYIQDIETLVVRQERIISFQSISQALAIETIAYPANTRCGEKYLIDTNVLRKGDRTIFPKVKGADCGSACFAR